MTAFALLWAAGALLTAWLYIGTEDFLEYFADDLAESVGMMVAVVLIFALAAWPWMLAEHFRFHRPRGKNR